MSDQYLGEIRMFGFNFAPSGWALCNGQTLSISQSTALFALIGTSYGGNGTTTFQLPNLQGRVPIHQGSGGGLSTYVVGQTGGSESTTLTVGQMPGHTHTVNATGETATNGSPKSKYLAANTNPQYLAAPMVLDTMNPSMINIAGGNQPFSNIQPYLTITFCIALVGIFPSRN